MDEKKTRTSATESERAAKSQEKYWESLGRSFDDEFMKMVEEKYDHRQRLQMV